ncbi:hypothetical protein ACB098_09G003200 [Castanea mollissima]
MKSTNEKKLQQVRSVKRVFNLLWSNGAMDFHTLNESKDLDWVNYGLHNTQQQIQECYPRPPSSGQEMSSTTISIFRHFISISKDQDHAFDIKRKNSTWVHTACREFRDLE